MRKKLVVCVMTMTLLLTVGCASYQKTAPVMGIRDASINTYVAADLDYENAQRVEGIVDTRTVLWFIPLVRNGNKTLESATYGRTLSHDKKQALYRAKESSGVDIILDPQFEIETHRWFFGIYKTKRVKVTGWGVNVKGIKEDTVAN